MTAMSSTDPATFEVVKNALYCAAEEMKVVLAESLGAFLDWIAGLLESGNFRLEAKAEELPLLRLFRLKNPPVNDFHDGARALLGAPGPFK